MSFEEKFDKILRQRVGESEFPFDASNWDKASRMIDAERGASLGAKTSKYFLLFGALFLVIAGITFFGITMNGGSAEKNTLAENKNNPGMNDNNQANGSKSGAAVLSVNSENNNDQSNSGNNNKGNNGSGNSDQNNSVSNENTNTSNNLSNTAEGSSNSGSENTENVNGGSGSGVSNNTSGNVNAGNNNSSDKNTNGNSDNKSKSGNVIVTGKAGSSLGNTIKVAPREQKKSGGKNKKGLNEKNKNSEKTNEEILNASKEVVVHENAENLEMRSSVLQIWNKEGVLKSTAYDFIRIYDNDYFTKNKRKTHYLNAEMGATYLFGWETAKGRDAKGINAFAGLNYGLYLSKRTSISLGVQLYNVSHITNAFYSKANYEYDFGSNGNYTNITTNSLYYFSIPVKAYYNIPKTNSKVGLGINTGLCFNGKSTVETYTERDKVKSNIVETKQKGYYEGVNNVNILVSAFYNYRLSKRMSVNGEVIYGLSDTYKNNISNTETKENNIGVRLSLQYTLFDK